MEEKTKSEEHEDEPRSPIPSVTKSVFFHDNSLLSWKRAAKKTQTELIKEDQTALDWLTSVLLTDLTLIFLIHKHDC